MTQLTRLDDLVASRAGELGAIAASWLEEGAHAVEIWSTAGLAARWAPTLELATSAQRGRFLRSPSARRAARKGTSRFPRYSGTHASITAAGADLGWVRLVGKTGGVTRRRLLADAAMIGGLVEHEKDLDAVVRALVASQDDLLGLVDMLGAAGPDAGDLRTSLAAAARDLLRVDAAVIVTRAESGWRVDSEPAALAVELRASVAGRRLELDDLRRELEPAWLVSSAPERIGVPLLLLVSRDTERAAWSPTIRLATAAAELCATLVAQADRHEAMLERQRLERQMEFAGQVQQHLLQGSAQRAQGLRVASRYRAAEAVGGDLYCVRSKGSQTLLALGDVSGKGAPAALLMAAARALFESHARTRSEPSELLAGIARDLGEDLDRNSAFLTLCVARYDADTGELTVANAGHAPVLLRTADGVELLEPSDPPIGVLDDAEFSQRSCRIQAGDVLLLASDGISEREDLDERQFGIERIKQLMEAVEGPPHRLIDLLVGGAERFAGGRPPSDDETLLVAQVCTEAEA